MQYEDYKDDTQWWFPSVQNLKELLTIQFLYLLVNEGVISDTTLVSP